MFFKIYNPPVFQGNLKKENYFEGWYFKHVSSALDHVYSFIPGISLNKEDPHSFVQIINGITGNTVYVTYPVSGFSWDRNKLHIKVGNSVFTDEFINLDIKNGNSTISGRIDYKSLVRYPAKVLSPGIMGWYSFVPFMECKHGIVSANHDLTGSLIVDGELLNFNQGKGYIEKDWGTSFPESWLWIQANNFIDRDTSLYFSVAKIPWLGNYFIGFISFLYYQGKFYMFSTYNNSNISSLKREGNRIFLTIENRHHSLTINVEHNLSGELRAPVSGMMSRRIKESINSKVSVSLSRSGREVYSDSSSRAGTELIEKIFEYFND